MRLNVLIAAVICFVAADLITPFLNQPIQCYRDDLELQFAARKLDGNA